MLVQALSARNGMRRPFVPYLEMLHRRQRWLKRVTQLDADPFSTPVNLDDVIAAARELKPNADADWH